MRPRRVSWYEEEDPTLAGWPVCVGSRCSHSKKVEGEELRHMKLFSFFFFFFWQNTGHPGGLEATEGLIKVVLGKWA